MKTVKKVCALALVCLLMMSLSAAAVGEEAEETAPSLSCRERAAAALADYEELLPWDEIDLFDIMGIAEEDFSDFIYLTDISGMDGREVVMICCVSPEALQRVEAALSAYLKRRVKETQNYLPDAWELLSRAVLVTRENTVLLVSGENAEAEAELLLNPSAAENPQ